ncbi:glutathione synthase [Desulfosarcina sp. OttesenSCG-928-A07]|nr:glutathione synthase [Desulfosarcina sp. OttesenSCG-928-G17]MDL2329176.1 glutathione synthase [Desulfosarcina sp. OttesenSCG-928-A07]
MILSFHPCYVADTNMLCAGRDPDQQDIDAIRAADAVILPQGCRESLYRLCRKHCNHVFPNYDARFQYPGKTGQARLFRDINAPHPQTWIFPEMSFYSQADRIPETAFPLVLKLDWGGEGETVLLVETPTDLEDALETVSAYERSGQPGFVLQRYIPSVTRTLRVVVMGDHLTAYWRVQEDTGAFGTSVSHGARIDADSDPDLQKMARNLTREFCGKTKINLAGFDFIPEQTSDGIRLLFLEINYFFGRTGLGGSIAFYDQLQTVIQTWLKDLGLTQKNAAGEMP